jgi:hypothetical protein
MSLPPIPYTRIFDFEAFSANNPATQQPGVQFEGEFDVIKISLDGLMSRLAEIQRDDGKLRPSALDETGIVDSVTTSAYNAVILLLNPIVTQSGSYKDISLQASSQAQSYANQCSAYLATALLHKNAAENSAILSANSANQAVLSLGATNVAAGTAQSAAYEAEQSKLATLVASNAATASLGSVQMLQQQLANQYDNMLDGDANLSDVSSLSESITNLGLNAEDQLDRSIYNRLKSMVSMYVDPNPGAWTGSYGGNVGIDSWLLSNFGLVFNDSTGLFQNATGYRGAYLGGGITGNATQDSTIGSGNTPTSTLAHRKAILIKRISMVASILKTTLLRIESYWGYNGDNRLITLQDFQRGQDSSLIKYHVWAMVQENVTDNIEYRFQIFEAPADGKQYARQDNTWSEVVIPPSAGISEYDNFKTYSPGEVVWLGGFIYRFNTAIGAAGYGPVTHPYAWTKLSASEIADITGLQTALDAKATTSALTTGLAGKANSSHTHTIANVTGLQAELNLKSPTSHNHDISGLNGVVSYFSYYQKRTLPVIYGNYAQDFPVSSSGHLHILNYATNDQGKVTFYSGAIGDRFYFYQTADATYPIQLVGAINIDNKTFTRGAKSYVEAVTTPDGVVVSGDLMFPPYGVLLSSSCDYVENLTDASGTSNWSGNFYSNNTYANGSGGTYSTGGYNQDGCWYPMGFCISYNVTLSESTLSWSGCSSSGTYTYSIGSGNIHADGVGGTYQSYTGGWSANSGDVIYDNGSSCLVKYDGMGGYYVEDNSGSGGGYGTYIGNFTGTYQFSYYNSYEDAWYNFDSYYFSEDRYDDGAGSYYTQNYNQSYVSYGTYLGYMADAGSGYALYADGNGSYYLS